MKITSLGHGGAFAGMAQGNTSFLIEFDSGKKMLFDCGTLTPYILRDEMGIDLREIDAVYISHGHADHCGGLALFLQSRYWIPKLDENGNRVQPTVFIADEVLEEIENFLDFEVRHFKDGQSKYIDDFAEIVEMYGKPDFTYEGVEFHLKQQTHVKYNGLEYKPVFGLSFEVNGKRVLFTADTLEVAPLYLYDVVFHDCETGARKSGAHAHFEDITAAYEAWAHKPTVYLVHYTNITKAVTEFIWFAKGNTVEL